MKSMLAAAIAVLALASPAHAAFTSAYTDLEIEECLVLEADDFSVSWSCPGYKGYPLMVTEGDLRFSLIYGFGAKVADGQTLPPFNNLGAKLEWRLSNDLGRWMPIATIVRYHTADPETGENKGQVLVVTQLVEGNSCHIAYVDAVANKDANEMARAAADASGDFDCASDEIAIIGKFGAY